MVDNQRFRFSELVEWSVTMLLSQFDQKIYHNLSPCFLGQRCMKCGKTGDEHCENPKLCGILHGNRHRLSVHSEITTWTNIQLWSFLLFDKNTTYEASSSGLIVQNIESPLPLILFKEWMIVTTSTHSKCTPTFLTFCLLYEHFQLVRLLSPNLISLPLTPHAWK